MGIVFLLRHARPQFENDRRIVLGQRTDPPLSADGRAQAKALRCLTEHIPFDGIWSSPMLRCRETAELISGGNCPVRTLERAKEIDYGLWDGLDFDEIRRNWPDIYAQRGTDMSVPPPGGELPDAAARRLESALLSMPEGVHLLVAHAGINRALICRLAGIPMSRNRTVAQDYGAVNILERKAGVLSVLRCGLAAEQCGSGVLREILQMQGR